MGLTSFLIVLFVINVVPSSAIYEINKCCPHGQMVNMVDGQIICELADNSSSKYDWLPKSVNETILNNLKVNVNNTQCSDRDVQWSGKFSLNFNENSVFLEDEMIFKDSSFCLEKLNYDGKILTVARKCPCSEQICIPKCCESGKHLNDTNHCKDSGNSTDWMFDNINETITGKYKITYGFPQCKDLNKTSKYVTKYKLNSNGFITTNVVTVIETSKYCGDYKQEGDGPRMETIFACFDKITISNESTVYGVMSLIGAFFFLMTTIFLFWIPELGGSPKWAVAIHTLCFFIAHLSMAYQQLSPSLFGKKFCIIIAFVTQFSFVAAFFWSSVMCIDLSRTFSSVRALDRKKQNEMKNFIRYSLYAWAGSLSVTLVTVVFEFSPILREESNLKPNFGEIKCWFIQKQAIWVYFFGPIGLLLSLNLVLFLYTSFKIIKLKRETKALQYDDNKQQNRKKNEKRFSLYFKIFMLMGLPWLTEIISWTLDDKHSIWHYFWYITDIINVMRAIFIFIMFCCKKKVWIEMVKKAPWLDRCKKRILNSLCGNKSIDINIEEYGTASTNLGPSESTNKDISNVMSKSNGNENKNEIK